MTFCRLLPRAPTSRSQPWSSRRRSAVVAQPSPAGEPIAGAALGMVEHRRRRALEDDLAAELAGAGAHLDDLIGRADQRRLVLDDRHRVAAIAQPRDRVDQPRQVGRVQPGRRLVEHVQHAGEIRAERRGERDALRLAAAERAQRPVDGEMPDADVAPDTPAATPPARRAAARPAAASGESSSPRSQASASSIAQRRRPRRCSARRSARPAPRAAAARRRTPGTGSSSASGSRRRGCASCTCAAPANRRSRCSPPNFRSGTPSRISRRCSSRQLAKRHVDRHAVVARQRQQLFQLVGVGRRVPRRDRPVANRLLRIRHDPLHVDVDHVAEPLARRAGAERVVVVEQLRLDVGVLDAARLAAQPAAEDAALPRAAVDRSMSSAPLTSRSGRLDARPSLPFDRTRPPPRGRLPAQFSSESRSRAAASGCTVNAIDDHVQLADVRQAARPAPAPISSVRSASTHRR